MRKNTILILRDKTKNQAAGQQATRQHTQAFHTHSRHLSLPPLLPASLEERASLLPPLPLPEDQPGAAEPWRAPHGDEGDGAELALRVRLAQEELRADDGEEQRRLQQDRLQRARDARRRRGVHLEEAVQRVADADRQDLDDASARAQVGDLGR